MYKPKPVIHQTKELSDKVYHHRLFGRVFTLHRMVNRRVNKMMEHRKEIGEYELEIQQLMKKIRRVEKKVRNLKSENKEIRREITSYREVLEGLKNQDELEFKPYFSVRIITKGGYRYLEGRIRLPTMSGRIGKEYTYSYGRFEKMVQKYESEKGSFPPTMKDEYKVVNLKRWLESDLEQRWWDGILILEG